MVRLLNFSISLLVLTLFIGCKNKFRYPKDLKTGIYEVTTTYNYPNDSNVTEVFNYFGPQKNQSSLIFTYSGNGYAKSFSIREVKGDPTTITFQVTDLNSNNFSIINCSFETIERKKNFLHLTFQQLSQQGSLNFESGELTIKKIQ